MTCRVSIRESPLRRYVIFWRIPKDETGPLPLDCIPVSGGQSFSPGKAELYYANRLGYSGKRGIGTPPDCLTKRLKPLIICAHGWRLKSRLYHRSPPMRTRYVQRFVTCEGGFWLPRCGFNRLGEKICQSTRHPTLTLVCTATRSLIFSQICLILGSIRQDKSIRVKQLFCC